VTDEIFVPVALDSPRYADSLPQVGFFDPVTKQFDPDGEFHETLEYRHYGPGVISRQMTQGGGGWGDPLDRDPERVKVDVRDEYVTIAGAARDYGVVVVGDPQRDPEGLAVDWDATRAVRDRLRNERLPGSRS
jgi:N-methylhydantoinase B